MKAAAHCIFMFAWFFVICMQKNSREVWGSRGNLKSCSAYSHRRFWSGVEPPTSLTFILILLSKMSNYSYQVENYRFYVDFFPTSLLRLLKQSLRGKEECRVLCEKSKKHKKTSKMKRRDLSTRWNSLKIINSFYRDFLSLFFILNSTSSFIILVMI